MPVKIRGEQELFRALEQKLGPAKMRKFAHTAQRKAANYILEAVKKEMKSIPGKYRTGASVEEATLFGPEKIGGEWVYTIHWRGEKDRYRLIHINEWGTVRNPSPPLKGAIARAVKNAERVYFKKIEQELRRELL